VVCSPTACGKRWSSTTSCATSTERIARGVQRKSEPRYLSADELVVSTEGPLRVRSRRGWDMTPQVGFLAQLPVRDSSPLKSYFVRAVCP
jgi:hypothetical protein